MKVTFNLARPTSDTETAVVAAIRYKEYRLNYGIGLSILPKFWNKADQKAKETKAFPTYAEFNRKLNKFRAVAEDVFMRYQNEHSQALPDTKAFKQLLDDYFSKGEKKAGRPTFFEFFKQLMEQSIDGTRVNPKTGKPINPNTIKAYKTTFEHLNNFRREYKGSIDFDTIDLSFYEAYKAYLIKKCGFKNNTVGKHFQIIKLVLNEATDSGHNTNMAFKSKRFVVIREQTDAIYLTEDEIKALAEADLSYSRKLDKTRDLFVLGCLTGLRYSDFASIQPEQISNNKIHITQSKTGENVVVPIHPIVKGIIQKYNGHLPAAMTNQKMNDYLKELCHLLPCFQTAVTLTSTKGGKTTAETFEKWQLVTTHTGRRSFATNEIKHGTPIALIMAITGHKTEKSFWRYVRLSREDYAQRMSEIWEKRFALTA